MRSFTVGMGLLLVVGFFLIDGLPGAAVPNAFCQEKYGSRFIWAGAVCPESPSEQIRLVSLEVRVRLGKWRYTVDAVSHLFNDGETMTVWAGFPITKWYESSVGPMLGNFRAWIDGRPAPFKETPDIRKEVSLSDCRAKTYFKQECVWRANRVTFRGHAETVIRAKFEAPYNDRSYKTYTVFAEYAHGPARYWKGRIGKAVFLVDSSQLATARGVSAGLHSPMGSRRIGARLELYEKRDFEPLADDRFAALLQAPAVDELEAGQRLRPDY